MGDRWSDATRRRLVLVLTVLCLVAGIVTALVVDGPAAVDVAAEEGAPARPPAKADRPTSGTSPTTAAPTTAAPTTAPPPTEPPTTAAPAPAAAPVTVGRFTMEPYLGLGAWVDVFDWSHTFTQGRPTVFPDDIDRMASLGVRTIYLQVSRYDHPVDIVDQDLLMPLLERARALGVRVVGWYLPTLTDPAADLRRTLAMAALPIDGIGIDIEARDVTDVAERNRRLVEYAAAVRAALPGEVISGIVLPPIVMEDINPNYWPGFPWRELAPHYDLWQPMGYWTNRRSDSGWRDGYLYTAANIDRVRERTGWLDAPVHPIGGIGNQTTPEQIAGMAQAARERGAIGGSIYDYRTTHDALWAPLAAFNQ